MPKFNEGYSYCYICGASQAEHHREGCTYLIGVKSPDVDPIQKVDEIPNMISRQKAAELLAYTSELINGERAKDYGEPHQSFEKIAKLWSTYLHTDISVTDVGMMMILLKVARNGRGKNKQDNFVDICGYASLAGSEFFKNDNSK